MSKLVTAMMIIGLMFAAGCGAAPEADGYDDEQSGAGALRQELATCAAGYHLHYIDWSSTAMSTDGACGGGRTLYYGNHFCEKNNQVPVWCSNQFAYQVFGYLYSNHQYGYVKQCALNGHC